MSAKCRYCGSTSYGSTCIHTATAPAATSASGAAPPPTAPAASTARPASMRNKVVDVPSFFSKVNAT